MRRHYNGLGQVVIEQKPAQNWSDAVEGCGTPNTGQEVDTYFAYDALGNQTTASVPKLMGRTGHATRTLDFAIAAVTGYDALSRPATLISANGEETTYVYAGRTTGL